MSKVHEIEKLFGELIELQSTEDQRAFLDEACGDDLQLRSRLEQLLVDHQHAGSFLDDQRFDATLTQPLTEQVGQQIGPFKLLQEIGQGGMGVVYMAEQREPVKRRVALKIIKPGMDTGQVIARFEAERQALAMMDHPNIAKVLEAGRTDSGRPYFVMELINGIPITQYCDEHHLTLRERLALLIPVCQAVQHAHMKGVIHRDLKPSNILVTEYDDEAVPKIIDFGVAKAVGQQLTDATLATRFGQIIGTLEYASPEQAKRNQLDVDTRSDIYSLGIVLYELLTGDTPFGRERLRAAALEEMLRMLREDDPPPPSTRLSTCATLPSLAVSRNTQPDRLSRAVRGEPDWIVMKALARERERRYQTATAFAEDIQNYLAGASVKASPPSVLYQLRKSLRRHRNLWLTSATVFLALVLGLTASIVFMRQAQTAQVEADMARSQAEDSATTAKQEAERSERTLTVLLTFLSRSGINPETDKEYTVSEALLELGDGMLTQLQNDGLVVPLRTAAEIHSGFGYSYFRTEQFDLAREHFERALTFIDRLPAEESEHDLCAIYTRLALSSLYCDSYKDAENYSQIACTNFDESTANKSILDIPQLVQMVAAKAQRPRVSEDLVRNTRALLDQHFGHNHGQWGKVGYWLLFDRKQPHLAEALSDAAITLHANNYDARKVLSFCYRAQGKQAEAIDILEEGMGFADEEDAPDKEFWSKIRIARTYCDLQDFETAERLLREIASDETLRKRVKGGAIFDLLYEHAYLLDRIGDSTTAKQQREELRTFANLASDRQQYFFGESFHKCVQLETEFRLAPSPDAGQFNSRLDQIVALSTDDFHTPYHERLYGQIALESGNHKDAMKHFEAAALTRPVHNEMYHLDDIEAELVKLYGKEGLLGRGQKFFETLLANRKNESRDDPRVAFTKVLLAHVMILNEKSDIERAKTLLTEAQAFFSNHKLTPAHVKNTIHTLLMTAERRIAKDNPPS